MVPEDVPIILESAIAENEIDSEIECEEIKITIQFGMDRPVVYFKNDPGFIDLKLIRVKHPGSSLET
jgi:hypothetical protein